MKSYLRFEPSISCGIIASPSCNITYDHSGEFAITGANQQINIWNIRQTKQVCQLSAPIPNYPYSPQSTGEVLVLAISPDKKTIACGFSTGDIQVYNYITKELLTTLRGHRSGISCLAFDDYDQYGQRMASGGFDNDIIIWDMIAYVGICRLREHKDTVTCIKYLPSPLSNLLISVSKDSLLKVWDINTSASIQTIIGHRAEIWSIAIANSHIDKNNEEIDISNYIRLYTGSSDLYIRAYKVLSSYLYNVQNNLPNGVDSKVIEFIGEIKRVDTHTDRCHALYINNQQNLLAVQSNGKTIEFYRIRSFADIQKKIKRRIKRQKEKLTNQSTNQVTSSIWESTSYLTNEGVDNQQTNPLAMQLSDELEYLYTIREKSKIKSFAFNPVDKAVESSKIELVDKVVKQSVRGLVSLVTNCLAVYDIPIVATIEPTKLSTLELQGHRSDVRGVSISSDGLLIATCSVDGVKVWSSKTLASLRTCSTDEAVSVIFAPGSRYVVVGTKDGIIQICDTISGEISHSEEAHSGAVWGLALTPDSKGFASGSADKVAKFWDFNLTGSSLSFKLSRILELQSEILSIRFTPTTSTKSNNYLAVSLIDHTVKIFFADTLKFYLSIYGHSLPVMSVDISTDNTLLISGSVDKTVKIWGLDFGDCHRSLLGHQDTVTCVRFQPSTHYFFSSSKDKTIRYWDADSFQQILLLAGHVSTIWSIEVSPDANYLVSVGQDKQIKLWDRTEDLVFIEEEKDRELESQIDKSITQQNQQIFSVDSSNYQSNQLTGSLSIDPTTLSTIKTSDSLKGSELIIDTIDLIDIEIENITSWQQINKVDSKTDGKVVKSYISNPRLLGLTPYNYLIRSLKLIAPVEVEQAMLSLPFHYVTKLITYLLHVVRQGLEIELCTRILFILIRSHLTQLSHSYLPNYLSTAQSNNLTNYLSTYLTNYPLVINNIDSYRQLIGTNIAGLTYIQNKYKANQEIYDFGQVDSKIDNKVDSKSNSNIDRKRIKKSKKLEKVKKLKI